MKCVVAGALAALSLVGARPAHAEDSLNTILSNVYGLANVSFVGFQTYFSDPTSTASGEAVFAGNAKTTDFGFYSNPATTTLGSGKLSNPNAGLTLTDVWHGYTDSNGDGYVDPGDASFGTHTLIPLDPPSQPFGLYIQPNAAVNSNPQTGTFYTQAIRNDRTGTDQANGYIPSTSTIVNGVTLVQAGVKTNVHALVFKVTKVQDKIVVGGKYVYLGTFTTLAVPTLVVAWEDEGSAGSHSTTSDYNDLVVQLNNVDMNPVPEPVYFQLGGLLLGGLVTLKLRRARRNA